MHILAISGKAGSGKDTTALQIKTQFHNQNRVLVTHYADLVKYICREFFGWNGEKDAYGRSLLQFVGTDVVRAHDENYWVNFVATILELFQDKWDVVIIPDCRFPNEINVLRDKGFDVTHIRVVRDGLESTLTAEQRAHSSETAMDDVEPDYYISNNGNIWDLHEKVSKFVKEKFYGNE